MQATLQQLRHGDEVTLSLRGDVVLDAAADLYEALRRGSVEARTRSLRLDFAAAGRLDTAGAVAAHLGAQLLRGAGKSCELVHFTTTTAGPRRPRCSSQMACVTLTRAAASSCACRAQ